MKTFRFNVMFADVLAVLLLASCVVSPAGAAPTYDLFSYWSFDDETNPYTDDTGNGYSFVPNGTEPVNHWSTDTPSGTGQSWVLSSGLVYTADFGGPISVADGFAVSCWFNTSDAVSHNNNFGVSSEWGTFWSHGWAGNSQYYVGQTVNNRVGLGNQVLRDGEWVNLTYVNDGAKGKFYVDGEFVAEHATDTGALNVPWNSFKFKESEAKVDSLSIWRTPISSNAVKALAGNKVDPATLATLTELEITLLANDLNTPQDNYAITILKDAPTAYWRMNDVGSGKLVDLSGNENHITLNYLEATPGTNVYGLQCPRFNSEGGMVAQTQLGMSLQDAYSLEFWLNPENLTNNALSFSGDSGWDYFQMHTWPYNWGEDNKFYAGHRADSDSRLEPRDYDETLKLNEWNYVAYTFDGTTGSLYLDGELVAEKDFSKGNAWSTFGINGLRGMLSDVGLYDYALSPEQISAHYSAIHAPSGVPEPTTWLLLALGCVLIPMLRRK